MSKKKTIAKLIVYAILLLWTFGGAVSWWNKWMDATTTLKFVQSFIAWIIWNILMLVSIIGLKDTWEEFKGGEQ